jgi:hypothetical protein
MYQATIAIPQNKQLISQQLDYIKTDIDKLKSKKDNTYLIQTFIQSLEAKIIFLSTKLAYIDTAVYHN